jgi:hypothetical protein
MYPDGYAPRPQEDVVIEALEAAVYPDRFRIFIHLLVSPFQQRPNLLVVARDQAGRVVSELDIIETMHHDMEFTMHLRLRGQDPAGEYTLTGELFYETRNPPQSTLSIPFTIPPAPADV